MDAILFFTAFEVALDAPDCVGAGLTDVCLTVVTLVDRPCCLGSGSP